MTGKVMKSIVPRGYAVPQSEIKRLADEVRAARAGELAGASEQDRVRIEEEIQREVRGKVRKPRFGRVLCGASG
jgi:hypothetical protein